MLQMRLPAVAVVVGQREGAVRRLVKRLRGDLHLVESLVEVVNDVLDVLDADGDANHVRRDAGRDLLLLSQLLVRGRGWVDDQRLRVAHIGQVAGELDALDELLAAVTSALDAEGEDRAEQPFAVVLLGNVVAAVPRQACVVNPCHLVVVLQVASQRQGVLAVPLESEAEGFEAEQQAPGIERALAAAEVSQALDPAADREADVYAEWPARPEDIPELHAVVAVARFGHQRVLAVVPAQQDIP